MATIKEIAALAGVSRGTVDRVLNDRGAVNPETAEKIRKIAKELDYKPNRAGLVLAAQKKRLKLGVILFSTGNPFFQDVLAGINEKAEELAGYNCTVITKQISFGVEAQLQAVKELLAERHCHDPLQRRTDPRLHQYFIRAGDSRGHAEYRH